MKKHIIFLTIFLSIATSLPIFGMEMDNQDLREKIERLMHEGGNLNENIGDITPLIFAVQTKDAELVHKLIAFGADINAQAFDGSTALLEAIRLGNFKITEDLIDHGARGDISDEKGETALSCARTYHFDYIVDRLLASEKMSKTQKPINNPTKKATAHTKKPKKAKKTKKEGKFKKKVQASINTVKYLLDKRKISVEIQRKIQAIYRKKEADLGFSTKKPQIISSCPPLILAVCENDLAEVTRLLENETIDVNAQEVDGWTALATACQNRNFGIVEKLANHKEIFIDLPLTNGTTPLMIATSSIEYIIPQNKMQLMIAAYNIEKNIDNNIPLDDESRIILQRNQAYAIEQSAAHNQILKTCFKIVRLLIEHGANIDEQDDQGSTPLIKAINFRNPKIAALLIDLGADITIKDKQDYDALFYAAGKGYLSLVKKLVKSGAQIDSKLGKDSPLLQAISKGHHEVIKFLKRKAMDQKNKKSDSNEENMPNEVANEELFENIVQETFDAMPDLKYSSDDESDGEKEAEKDSTPKDTTNPKAKMHHSNAPIEGKETDSSFKKIKTKTKEKINYLKRMLQRKNRVQKHDEHSLAAEFDALSDSQESHASIDETDIDLVVEQSLSEKNIVKRKSYFEDEIVNKGYDFEGTDDLQGEKKEQNDIDDEMNDSVCIFRSLDEAIDERRAKMTGVKIDHRVGYAPFTERIRESIQRDWLGIEEIGYRVDNETNEIIKIQERNGVREEHRMVEESNEPRSSIMGSIHVKLKEMMKFEVDDETNDSEKSIAEPNIKENS